MVDTKQSRIKILPEPLEPLTDWRGCKLQVGNMVLYGAGVGRSIAMVEGTVAGFTASGRVWVHITRRAYGTWQHSKDIVDVGADRLTVVFSLPKTNLPTQAEVREAEEKRIAEWRQKNPRNYLNV